MMRAMSLLLVVALVGAAGAQSAADLQVAGFAQRLALPAPFAHGPAPDWQDANARARIAEFVPAGQSVTLWTQMITVTVQPRAPGDNAGNEAAVQRGLAMLGGNYDRGCAAPVQRRTGADLTPQGSLGARPVVLICPQVTGTDVGEAMAALVILGTQDLFTLQWAERFPAGGKETAAIPPSVWDDRLRHLARVRLCGATGAC